MKIYTTKVKRLPGTDYAEVYSKAKNLYKAISSRTKRRPYVRSAYFGNEKVFLDYFWDHIFKKNFSDRKRRLGYYACALDLIQNSKIAPISKINPEDSLETLHRFSGVNGNSEEFFVQIKEDMKTGQKHFISVFPNI
jgi:acyl carrier protein phosphodiesterase